MLLLLGSLLALAPTGAWAWGEAGHQIVAEIAEARLTPRARRMVHELLGEVPLSAREVACWADAQRDPATRGWHWTDIPFGARGYEPARDCPRGACAVQALRRAEGSLAGRGAAVERVDALRWVVHLVADLHQPLHAGDPRDRGGNDLRVRLRDRRQPTNLHRVWDFDVVKPLVRGRTPAEVARALLAGATPEELDAAAVSDPVAWAEESSRTARAVYAELGRTPGDDVVAPLRPWDYERAQRPRVERALLRAGLRLAAALDRAAAQR